MTRSEIFKEAHRQAKKAYAREIINHKNIRFDHLSYLDCFKIELKKLWSNWNLDRKVILGNAKNNKNIKIIYDFGKLYTIFEGVKVELIADTTKNIFRFKNQIISGYNGFHANQNLIKKADSLITTWCYRKTYHEGYRGGEW